MHKHLVDGSYVVLDIQRSKEGTITSVVFESIDTRQRGPSVVVDLTSAVAEFAPVSSTTRVDNRGVERHSAVSKRTRDLFRKKEAMIWQAFIDDLYTESGPQISSRPRG